MLAPLIRIRTGEEVTLQVINRTAQSRVQHFTPGQSFKDCEIRNCEECIRGERVMQRYMITVLCEGQICVIDLPYGTYREVLLLVGDQLEPISEPMIVSRDLVDGESVITGKFRVRLVN